MIGHLRMMPAEREPRPRGLVVQPRSAPALTPAAAMPPRGDYVAVVGNVQPFRNAALTAVALTCCANVATAQFPGRSDSRTVGVTAAFGCNVLLGGLTAATRALIEGHDPARAFAIGALGGAVHFGAKLIGPGTGPLGLAVGATGTAILVNAGRGVSPLDELYVPVGPLRLRVAPRASHKFRLAVNARDAFLLTRNLTRDGLVVDWGRSASSGTFVFFTQGRAIRVADREAVGVAPGPLIIVSAFSANPGRTMSHEVVHVHQYWFVDEAWGRPIEEYLRRRVPGARRLPRWLELGIVPPAFAILEHSIFGLDGPVRRLKESEAEILER